jgi:hypothetical protein
MNVVVLECKYCWLFLKVAVDGLIILFLFKLCSCLLIVVKSWFSSQLHSILIQFRTEFKVKCKPEGNQTLDN